MSPPTESPRAIPVDAEELFSAFNDAFILLRETNRSTESKLTIISHVLNLLYDLEKDRFLPKNPLFVIGLFTWVTHHFTALLSDFSLASCHSLVASCYSKVFSYLFKTVPGLLCHVLLSYSEFIYDVAQYHEDPTSTPSHTFKVSELLEAGFPQVTSVVLDIGDDEYTSQVICFWLLNILEPHITLVEIIHEVSFKLILMLINVIELGCGSSLSRSALILLTRLICGSQPSNSQELHAVEEGILLLNSSSKEELDDIVHCLCSIADYLIHELGCAHPSLNTPLLSAMLEIFIFHFDHLKTITDCDEWVKSIIGLYENSKEDASLLHFTLSIPNSSFLVIAPFLEAYLLRSLKTWSLVETKNIEKDYSSHLEKQYIVEKPSVVWQLCLRYFDPILSRNDATVHSLLMGAKIIQIGQNAAFVIHQEVGLKLIFFEYHLRRVIAKLPGVIEKSLNPFSLSGFSAAVDFTASSLLLCDEVTDIELPLQHLVSLFMYPWTTYHTFLSESDVLMRCMDGLMYLTIVLSPEVSTKYVLMIIHVIIKRFLSEENVDLRLVSKSVELLMAFLLKGHDSIIHEVISVFTDYLSSGNVKRLFLTGLSDKTLMCFLSNRCFLKWIGKKWVPYCVDCDCKESSSKFNLISLPFIHYIDSVSWSFLNSLIALAGSNCTRLSALLPRYVFHSDLLRSDAAAQKLLERILNPHLSGETIPIKYLECLLYNRDMTVNEERMQLYCETVAKALNESHELNSSEKRRVHSAAISVATLLIKILKSYQQSPFINYIIAVFIGNNVEPEGLQLALRITQPHISKWFTNFVSHGELSIGKLLAELIIRKLQLSDSPPCRTLEEAARFLGLNPSYFIFSSITPHTLFNIMITCDEALSTEVILGMAASLDVDVKTFLARYFENIFTDLYFANDSEKSCQCLQLLLRLTESDMQILTYCKFSNLVKTGRLVLNSQQPIKIIRYLLNVVSPHNLGIDVELSLLKQHFIGCLTIMDSILTTKQSSLHLVKSCFKSISSFIKVLGEEIVTSIRSRLLATLRMCLPRYYSILPNACLLVWMNFCYCVDLSLMAPYIVTIVTCVFPLFHTFPEDVSQLIHYLIVKNKHHFSEYIPDLNFLPKPQNDSTKYHWEISATIANLTNDEKSFLVKIERAINHVEADSVEARLNALSYLGELLKQHHISLHELYLKNDTLHPIFEKVLECLTSNLSFSYQPIRLACAECIGYLGAIDPSKFKSKSLEESVLKDKYNTEGEHFTVFCVGVLVRSIIKHEDTIVVTTIYGCIQELLRIRFSEQPVEIYNKFLDNFSTNERDLLEPLMHTKYVFNPPQFSGVDATSEFGAHTRKRPSEWAANWSHQLISYLPDSLTKRIFITCIPSMHLDTEVLEEILPHILLHSLLLSSKKNEFYIEKEMKAILHWDMSRDRTALPSHMDLSTRKSCSVVHSDASQSKFVDIILNLLDFLNQAVTDLEIHGSDLGFLYKKKNTHSTKSMVSKIRSFLEGFVAKALSWKSYVHKGYARSLFFLEKSLCNTNEFTETDLLPMKNIYLKLNDIDGLDGVVRTTKNITPTEDMLISDVLKGKIQDAISGYESLGSKFKSSSLYRCLLQCYLNINQPSAALGISKKLLEDDKIFVCPSVYNEYVESLWETSSYEQIDFTYKTLERSPWAHCWSWDIDAINVLRLMRNLDMITCATKLVSIRKHIIKLLLSSGSRGMELYKNGYSYIVKLHVLNEMDLSNAIMSQVSVDDSEKPMKILSNFVTLLNKRLDLLPSSGYHTQGVVKIRRQMMKAMSDGVKFNETYSKFLFDELGKNYLLEAKVARRSFSLLAAHTGICLAENYPTKKMFIERAKYFKAKNEIDAAIRVLKQGLKKHFDQKNLPHMDPESLLICAKAKRLVATYDVENLNVDFIEGYRSFKEASTVCDLEKNYVHFAQYLYKQHMSEENPDATPTCRNMQHEAAVLFSKSLLHGCKYLYHSMPVLLSLWLDYGARMAKCTNEKSSKKLPEKCLRGGDYVETMNSFTQLMENNIVCLPTYMFMSAFTQILSRINHRQPECYAILQKLICNILREYPQQGLWSFIGVCKTPNPMQRKRTEEIVRLVKSEKNLAVLFKLFNHLADRFIGIAGIKFKPHKPSVPLKSVSSTLAQFISSKGHAIMMPLEKCRSVTIPHYKFFNSRSKRMEHNPRPVAPVHFAGVSDEVGVLYSIQMPKKLEFLGSDGHKYILLSKTDDLRLDARIMEFNAVVNTFLRRDSGAVAKNLSIRTYCVTPLNPQCGIIEWVNGVQPLKAIVSKNFQKSGIVPMSFLEMKNALSHQSIEKKVSVFQNEILPRHPPVLHKWFFEQFPAANTWFTARGSFIKTLAAMSIVGYIVGLGDRHCENVLIDTSTGEFFHVDFNCLFNKGDKFMVPEMVPFRLTANLVRAMGPTGTEGPFLTFCEITNRVMREHSEELISVIKPFLYDIDAKSFDENNWDDQANEEAKVNIHNVRLRLNGAVRFRQDPKTNSKHTKPLSVEGQTRRLISEATSSINLCQMYVGWSPHY